jgi:hypothetical protein
MKLFMILLVLISSEKVLGDETNSHLRGKLEGTCLCNYAMGCNTNADCDPNTNTNALQDSQHHNNALYNWIVCWNANPLCDNHRQPTSNAYGNYDVHCDNVTHCDIHAVWITHKYWNAIRDAVRDTINESNGLGDVNAEWNCYIQCDRNWLVDCIFHADRDFHGKWNRKRFLYTYVIWNTWTSNTFCYNEWNGQRNADSECNIQH